ncbi:MAG: hypothetical protein K9N47_24940 [Prosthecobacter sp.]|uniref:secretin N-terminal domain-containing protein n=1 Tax=Prosthecobacter sp. TaxID=1965333 RepID=UPI00261D8FC9|nr:secretin N-terminal domain-containing protein [Prosthecobacter sp.]MCF7789392.1 hypothetical protein [Prosthecobacter sp.]
MILRPEDLPDADQVVTHVLQLNHLGAEDASMAFQTIIPLHPYGRMLAVPNSQSVVISEASQTIRAYLELAQQVDQPPMETVQKTIRIERAEAQEVVEQLEVLLGLDKPSAGAAAPGSASPAPAASLANSSMNAARPLMQAVARTNSMWSSLVRSICKKLRP